MIEITKHIATPVVNAKADPGTSHIPLLDVEDLHVSAQGENGMKIIDGLNLRVHAGEIVALVGESGSGKSMTAMSLIRLLPEGVTATRGRIKFGGKDVLAMSPQQLNHLRGGHIAMIFQQPQAMLDPTSRVGIQVAEALRQHRAPERLSVTGSVIKLLRDVGIPEPALRARCFAHELSGGMAQRVMIAAAMSGEPELLIADEPTTALDVTVQAQILKLLDEQRHKRNIAVLLITHDLSIVSALADRVAVMYAGRIVEEGPARSVLKAPRHPYTRALVQCSLLKADHEGRLFSIPSGATQPHDIHQGCRFHPRCATAAAMADSSRCTHHEPALDAYDAQCNARCWAACEAAMPVVAVQTAAMS